ncbi:unnamed protein product, partial [Symbiodinium necroappetens]
APVVVQTNGLLVANYGLQNNSDANIKANQQPTPLADLKTVFDAVEVKSYTRTDTPQPEDRIGFIAQEILASGTLGPKLASMQENGLYGLDYSRLTWQAEHEGPRFQQPRLRVLDGPEPRLQVPDYFQRSDGKAIPVLQSAWPPCQSSGVFSAHRGGPDHVKVARGEHWYRLPRADVGADGGTCLGIDVKGRDFPPQLLEGFAHRARARAITGIATMTLRLGSVQTNLKGGKYLPAEPPVCWNTTQWAEILYALVAVEVRLLWIMGQQCGLLMEAKDLKLQVICGPWQLTPRKLSSTLRMILPLDWRESPPEIFIRDVANLLQRRQAATSLAHPIRSRRTLASSLAEASKADVRREADVDLLDHCKANFDMLRIGHYSLTWERNFRRWIQSVDVTWNILNDNVFHKLVDEVGDFVI